jgi:peptidyl serine alpha-galactosyltransferase
LQDIFVKEIESMRPGYHHLHLTPDYSRIPKKTRGTFKYFNKPFGVRHWMEHALGYPDNHKLHDDSIIVLLDPDQILLRPFTGDFSNSSEVWRLDHEYGPRRIQERPKFSQRVQHGSPFSQQYGYGIQWLYKVHPEYIFQDRLPTPVSNMTPKEARNFYFAMGPPYIATAKDMWSIVTTWSDIVPKVHDEYPYLLAEYVVFSLFAKGVA